MFFAGMRRSFSSLLSYLANTCPSRKDYLLKYPNRAITNDVKIFLRNNSALIVLLLVIIVLDLFPQVDRLSGVDGVEVARGERCDALLILQQQT